MKNNNYFKLAGVLGLIACGSVWAEDLPDCEKINGTLAPKASCQISGDFTPTEVGEQTVSVTLSYVEGEDVPLETTTKSYESIVKGDIIEKLPPSTAIGISYPVKFTFTNTTEAPVTGINIDVKPLAGIKPTPENE